MINQVKAIAIRISAAVRKISIPMNPPRRRVVDERLRLVAVSTCLFFFHYVPGYLLFTHCIYLLF